MTPGVTSALDRAIAMLREVLAFLEGLKRPQSAVSRGLAPDVTDDELLDLGKTAVTGHLNFVKAREWFRKRDSLTRLDP